MLVDRFIQILIKYSTLRIQIFSRFRSLKNVQTGIYVKIRSSNLTQKLRKAVEKENYISDIIRQQGRSKDENQEGVNNIKNADYNFLLNVCSINM
jgi:hypothetical protein